MMAMAILGEYKMNMKPIEVLHNTARQDAAALGVDSGFGVGTPFAGAVRLSPATRELTARYLSGEIGRTV